MTIKFMQTNQNGENEETPFLNMLISFLMLDTGDAFG